MLFPLTDGQRVVTFFNANYGFVAIFGRSKVKGGRFRAEDFKVTCVKHAKKHI